MGDWQPIETAPRDKPVLVAYQVSSRFYVSEALMWDEGWYLANTAPSDYHDGRVYRPTHWMPLPAPPGEVSDG